MNQDTRVLIAFAMSFVMLVLWRVFYVKAPPKPPPAPTEQSQKAAQATKPGQAAKVSEGKGAVPAAPAAAEALPLEQGTAAQDVVVESPLFRVTFSTVGAVAKSWVLKKYHDARGEPLDVIDGQACEKLGYPMSVEFASGPGASQAGAINQGIFVAQPAGKILQAPVKLDFEYSDGKVRVKKEFTFGEGYEVHAQVSVWNGKDYLPVAVEWPGGFGDQSLTYLQKQAFGQAAYSSAGKIETVADAKLKARRAIAGPLEFAGLEDQYFAGIFLPEKTGGDSWNNTSFSITPETWTPPDWKEKEPPRFVRASLGSSLARPLQFRLFVAPKDLDVLRAESAPLEGLVDFGWFTVFAKPLFLAMRYIYDHWAHNYGWAIIILTIIINMLMFPLKLKQIRSAQEMQKVAPLIKSIQDRYKQYKFNDPRKQRMNQEIMKIYKDHGVNPLGSCLPMALQIPFFIGFYRVLELSIELRHAPWIWWVKDLSAPETVQVFGYGVHILPIFMIIASFFMQKMTPMPTVDPSQQRMMMVMPIFLGFIFYKFASGLVLYYLVASLVGIAQQVLINKTARAPVLSPAAPKASEAAK